MYYSEAKYMLATAIYGSRGANGVVLITTKNGSRGEKGSIEVDIKTGVNEQIIPRYDVLTNPEEYIGYVWEGIFNRGTFTGEADPVAFANSRLLTDNGIGAGYNMWAVADASELIDPATRSVRAGVNRLFTPEDLENLKMIYFLVKEKGFTLEGAKNKLRENPDEIFSKHKIIMRLEEIKHELIEIKNQL